jgi:pentose-5-phosphate-3-epimerase
MGRTTVKLASSILAVDSAHLAEQVADAEEAGADWIHIGQRSQPCNSE